MEEEPTQDTPSPDDTSSKEIESSNESREVTQNTTTVVDSPRNLPSMSSNNNDHTGTGNQPNEVEKDELSVQVWSLKEEVAQLKAQLAFMKEKHESELQALRSSVDALTKVHQTKQRRHLLLKGYVHSKPFEGHKGGVYAAQFHGKTLVTGSGDKTVRVWNMDTRTCTNVLTGHTNGVCCLFVNEAVIVSGSWDKTIRVWDRRDLSKEPRVLKAHVNGVRCLQVRGNTLVSGASDKLIFVWDLERGQCELVLKGHESGVYCVEFDDDVLVSGSGDSTVRVWDMDAGKCTKVLRGHTGDVYSVKFHRHFLVSGAMDKTVRVWDLDSGEVLRVLLHPDAVFACALTPKLIFTGCADSSIRLWDLTSGECMRVIKGHSEGIYSLYLQGDVMITGSVDKTARLWRFEDSDD